MFPRSRLVLLAPGALLGLLSLPASAQFRAIDGRGNNVRHQEWGSAGIPLLRVTTPAYEDGRSTPAGSVRPGARALSNAVCAQPGQVPMHAPRTDFLWQWGQFLDHDIDLSPSASPREPFDVPIPQGDPWFDPFGTGQAFIPVDRTLWVEDRRGVRQQLNVITAWIDGSMVYGSDDARARALRTLDGTGRLKVTPHATGDLLPFNVDGLPNAPVGSDPRLFLAGDVRANEQVGLTSMHTLFVREHNFWAERLGEVHPGLPGERRYQLARAMVVAEIQRISYEEFLPALLGEDPLPPYTGYDARVDPGIANFFSTAAYRFGHSMLSSNLLRRDAQGRPIPSGDLPLREAFFAPHQLLDHGGIEPILRGLALQQPQEIDPALVDDVRNFLFGPPGSGGFDLAALNLQRGRDHGLPSYTQARLDLGLSPVTTFDEITSDPARRAVLEEMYASPEHVDAWVGGLSEDPVGGGLLGELFRAVVVDQFTRLRDGDRFWYERSLPRPWLRIVESTSLADVIRRNTSIGEELQDDVFRPGS